MFDRRFTGCRAIVTGGARGIGARVVDGIASSGGRVVAIDVLGPEAVVRHRRWGTRVTTVDADLAEASECRRAVAAGLAWLGGLDCLINNAGVTMRASLDETTDDFIDLVLRTNLVSMLVCAREALPALTRSGGAIVNVASINAISGNVDLSAYAASKGGAASLTRALAIELAHTGVRVNCVSPATVDTPMTDEHLASAEDPEGLRAQLVDKHPLGRLASDADVADAILYLASSAAGFVTGVNLPVDGGRSIR